MLNNSLLLIVIDYSIHMRIISSLSIQTRKTVLWKSRKGVFILNKNKLRNHFFSIPLTLLDIFSLVCDLYVSTMQYTLYSYTDILIHILIHIHMAN